MFAILLIAGRMAQYGNTADEAAQALVEDGFLDETAAERARKLLYRLTV